MKIRDGFVSNSSSSSYILVYKDCFSKEEFFERFDKDFRGNFCIYKLYEEFPYEADLIFITSDRIKEHMFNNPELYDFGSVYVYPKLHEDWNGPVEITPEFLGYKMKSYMSTASDESVFNILYDDELYDETFKIYLGEGYPFKGEENED